MEEDIKKEIENIIACSDSILRNCYLDIELDRPIKHHLEAIKLQITILNDIVKVLNISSSLDFNLKDELREMEIIGYRLYEMKDRIII